MIYLSIGTNLGNRLHNIERALGLLRKRCLPDLAYSIILETEALLPPGAPPTWNHPYLNMVVCGHSTLSPEYLLREMKEIEHEIGRPLSYEKWAPRLIDLDILLWDDVTIHRPHLTVPHPELLNRPFLIHLLALLNPLHKFPPQDGHPFSNQTFGTMADTITNLSFIKSLTLYPKFVGIVNVTPDSFSDGGLYFETHSAVHRALELSSYGASIVELGAQSTRPTAEILSPQSEYARLAPVFEELADAMKAGTIRVSLDSYWPEVILKIVKQYPIAWVNDVKGCLDSATLKTLANHGCQFVAMHALAIPTQRGQHLDSSLDPIDPINEWATRTINRLLQAGFNKEDIVIDPGIGFGKSAYQSRYLIRYVERIKQHGCQVLVGHSRKSFMTSFCTLEPHHRDLETVAVSSFLHTQGIDFLRVHDVQQHQRFFVAHQVMWGGIEAPS